MIRHKGVVMAMAVMFLVTLTAGACLAGEAMVSGTVTPDNQLVGDDGQMYQIADTDSGNQLMEAQDKKVEVMGTVAEKDGSKVITVTSFKVLE